MLSYEVPVPCPNKGTIFTDSTSEQCDELAFATTVCTFPLGFITVHSTDSLALNSLEKALSTDPDLNLFKPLVSFFPLLYLTKLLSSFILTSFLLGLSYPKFTRYKPLPIYWVHDRTIISLEPFPPPFF